MDSFVSRESRSIFDKPTFTYEDVINAIDWNRVLIQARIEHLRHIQNKDEHPTGIENIVCGECIKTILLKTEE